MANTLTNLVPDLYEALDVVSRELVGMIPSVSRNSSAERAAKDQTIRIPITPANSASDITPAMSVPSIANQTVGNTTLSISKSRYAPFSWNGEEQRGQNNAVGYQQIKIAQMAQAFRTLVNEIETDLATVGYQYASRAYGTAATTPFASTLADSAQVRKILDDNGAPLSGRSLVIDTTAGAALRTLTQLTKANEAGSAMTLRDGELLNLHGFSVKESAQIVSPTVGTASGATSDNAGYSIGDTVITLASAGTGTLTVGDVIVFAGDTNKYVIASGDTDVSNGGTITLAEPGLKKAMSAATKAITVSATGPRNLAFSQNAIQLVTRAPMRPEEGDLATDVEIITDPRSGMAFEVSVYPGFRTVTYHVSIAWGYAAIKPEHIAVLLG